MKISLLTTLLVVIFTKTKSLPVTNDEENANLYLFKYGYLTLKQNSKSGSYVDQTAIRKAILDFQTFAGIEQTGELNEETKELMKLPRCGVKDRVGRGTDARRKKRYALQGSRWKKRDLKYRISSYPDDDITPAQVDKELARAFKVWSDVADIKFVQSPSTDNTVHIDIRFAKGEHGDGDPFDGVGGTLAHAFFPIYGGDAHFDDDEKWSIGSYRGTNLFQVAAHEFGHSLGLSHSDEKSSLMAPFYRGYQSSFKLDKDDINGIQALYGPKRDSSVTTARPAVTKPTGTTFDVELCADSSIDAIVTTYGNTTYAFKGNKYWALTADGVAHGYPRPISEDWDGLPGNLDTAFTYTNGRTYFFKGSNYWRFTDERLDKGYPKKISEGFEGIPNSVDAAFVWSGNGKIYFFKGSQYWRFDVSNTQQRVSKSYPRPISTWRGIPDNIDDAVKYSNGYTYFFKNGQYYRFNDGRFKVDVPRSGTQYPRPVGFWWFGCKSESYTAEGRIGKNPGPGRSSSSITEVSRLLIFILPALQRLLR